MTDLTDILPPPDQAAFDMLEQETQQSFPASFRAFFSSYNGAKTDGIELQSASRDIVIERFLAVLGPAQDSAAAPYDISVVTAPIFERFLASEDSERYDLVPFAALFAGDMLCLDFRNGTEPAVVHWDHEKSTSFNPVANAVAPDFDSFLELAGIPRPA